MPDVDDTLKSLLRDRLAKAPNPQWYMTVLGVATEQSRDDLAVAIAATDDIIAEQPWPPESESMKAIKFIAEKQAMDEYLRTPIPEPKDG